MFRFLRACVALALLAGPASAGIDNAGTTAGNFLSVGTGASILSMGGATLGTGDDLHAAAWNPASLARVDVTQFALSHASLASQSSLDLVTAGGRLAAGETRWAASVLYQGENGFDGRDALGNPTGTFGVSSMAFGLQFAHPVGEHATAGLGARWLSDNLGDAHGSGMALDAGAQAAAGAFGFGVAARNIGGSMRYASGRYDLPSVVGVGTSWSDAAHGVRLALDANFPHAYYDDLRMGAEWRWQDRVALRAGYRLELGATPNEPLGGPSFGVGLGANGVWMDYAFLAGDADAQGQHRLGLTFRPGWLGGSPMRSARRADPVARPTADARRVLRSVSRQGALLTTTPVTLAIVAPAPLPRMTPSALVAETPAKLPAAKAAPAKLAIDLTDRVPPGGTESEVYPRYPEPWRTLEPSDPVAVTPLAGEKGADDSPMLASSESRDEKPSKREKASRDEKPAKAPKAEKASRAPAEAALASAVTSPKATPPAPRPKTMAEGLTATEAAALAANLSPAKAKKARADKHKNDEKPAPADAPAKDATLASSAPSAKPAAAPKPAKDSSAATVQPEQALANNEKPARAEKPAKIEKPKKDKHESSGLSLPSLPAPPPAALVAAAAPAVAAAPVAAAVPVEKPSRPDKRAKNEKSSRVAAAEVAPADSPAPVAGPPMLVGPPVPANHSTSSAVPSAAPAPEALAASVEPAVVAPPAVVKSEPVALAPAPVEAPKPAVVAPAPAVVKSEPVAVAPAPVEAPKPVVVAPAPAVVQSEPVAVAPAPVEAPKPVVVAPAPAVVQSEPVAVAPAPAPARVEAPTPVVVAPAPVVETSEPAAVAPTPAPAPADAPRPVEVPPVASAAPAVVESTPPAASAAPAAVAPAMPVAAPVAVPPAVTVPASVPVSAPAPVVAPAPATSAPTPAPTAKPVPASAATIPNNALASTGRRVVVVTHVSKDPWVNSAPKQARPEEITVQDGETLEDIARFWGTSAAALMMENNLVKPKVKKGQKLKLPH
jgi:LysM repeat protein